MSPSPASEKRGFMDRLEENMIALLLGLMTLVTFANVLARYVFATNLLWALETTVFIFAWLVLLGASYGVRKTTHIGVDVLLKMVSPPVRRAMSICAVLACIAFSLLLLKGSWDYWYPFVSKRAWLETDDVPMFWFLRFFESLVNEGETYEKMPRFIPYFVLPLSMCLLSIRFIIAGFEIIKGTRDGVIASHEVEELMEGAHLYAQHDDVMITTHDDVQKDRGGEKRQRRRKDQGGQK